jgi:hypothetical protein
MSNNHINRYNYSTNVRAFKIKRKTVEGIITLLWHLAPAFTLKRVADLFFATARPNVSAEQSWMIAHLSRPQVKAQELGMKPTFRQPGADQQPGCPRRKLR